MAIREKVLGAEHPDTATSLKVIDDDLAVQYLPAKKIKRFRLALA